LKILHFSDTHLGYNELDRVSKNGINLREQDFYESFTQVIDEALKRKPDLMVHSGDFFHRPSPANRPMVFAINQLHRLSEANIPIVIIAGNHSTPKTIYTNPILEAFKSMKGVYPIFGQNYETVEFDGIVVHGLPHINDEKHQILEMDKMLPVPNQLNILLLHTSIGKNFMMEEYGEQFFPPERLELLNKFDYVALGHWHNFQKVSVLDNAWYSGSTERMSDTEAGKKKGFCWLELEKNKPAQPTFIPIETRDWFRIDLKKCQDKNVQEIEEELLEAIKILPLEEAIISIYFHQITNMQALQLSNRHIYELMEGPIHVAIKRKFVETSGMFGSLDEETDSLEELLKAFIKREIKDEETAKQLINKTQYYFDQSS